MWDVCNECVGYERRALRHDEGERPQHGGRVGRRHRHTHSGKRQTHKVTVLMSLGIKAGIILFDDTLDTGAFAHSVMGRRIDPSWGGPIELFLIPASAPQLV